MRAPCRRITEGTYTVLSFVIGYCKLCRNRLEYLRCTTLITPVHSDQRARFFFVTSQFLECLGVTIKVKNHTCIFQKRFFKVQNMVWFVQLLVFWEFLKDYFKISFKIPRIARMRRFLISSTFRELFMKKLFLIYIVAPWYFKVRWS